MLTFAAQVLIYFFPLTHWRGGWRPNGKLQLHVSEFVYKDKGMLIHKRQCSQEIRTLALQGAINQSRSYSVAVLGFFPQLSHFPLQKIFTKPCLGSLPGPRMEHDCHSSPVAFNLEQLKIVFHDLVILKKYHLFYRMSLIWVLSSISSSLDTTIHFGQ